MRGAGFIGRWRLFFRVGRIRRRVTMKGLRFRNPFLFLVVVFLIFVSLMFSGAKSKAEQLIGDWWVGVYLNATNDTYSLNTPLSISNDTNKVAGIFVENDTRKLLNDLTINATLSAEFNNASAVSGKAYGIYFKGMLYGSVRPLGNLTITSNGVINATATGRNADASGVYASLIGNIGNFTMTGGTISATANATGGNASAYGVSSNYIGNFTMQGGTILATANATGGEAWTYGVFAGPIGNFTMTGGLISATANATGVAGAKGVRGYSIGNFTMQGGTILATANVTGRDAYADGVYAEWSIDNFTMQNGTISATANATGGNAWAYGVSGVSFNFTMTGGTISATANSTGAAVARAVELGRVAIMQGGTILANATGVGYTKATGVYAFPFISNFIMTGMRISATAKSTGNYSGSNAWAYGVDAFNIGNFTMTGGTISATANSIYNFAMAYGVSSHEYLFNPRLNYFLNNFTMTGGTISATANSTGHGAWAFGVRARTIGNFTMQGGTISANSTANATGGIARAVGVYAEPGIREKSYIGNFTMTGGTILATANATGGEAYASGVSANYIGNFTMQNGTISATATGRNYANATGVYADSSIDNFTVQGGTILATANVTGRDAWAFGVLANSTGNFTMTSGTILANATGGYARAFGVSANYIGNFTMQGGTILATANTTGGIARAYGVSANYIGNFTMQGGTILATANATGGVPDAYGVHAGSIGNLSIESGKISATAIGNYNISVHGAYLGALGNFVNKGTIEVTVKSLYSNATINAYALAVRNSSNADITNNGTMKVILDLPVGANMTNVNAGVFYIKNSNATISNYGKTWVESNVAGGNLRTLHITGSSQVTLRDKFAITFGAPGINPEMRPIYVGAGSTLNLNNATLIAGMDSRNLQYRVPYYLIENYGNVTGQWGGLERGYANTNISVSWYNATSLGADSAVIFEYTPGTIPGAILGNIAPVIGGTAAGPIIISSLTGFVFDYSPLFMKMVRSDNQPVMLASAGVSEAGYAGLSYTTQGKGLAWLMPLYTRVNADDLGFDADSYGFAFGLGGRLTKNSGVEIYTGYLRNRLDFSVRGADSEDQDLYFGGFNFIYTPGSYFAKLNAFGYYGKHDYKGYTGLNYDLVEKANYDSYGMRIDLTGGYVYGKKVKVMPQIGLSYGYYNTESFWTKVSANPGLRRHYKPDTLDVWKVIAGLELISDIETKGKMRIRAYGGVRLEQAISDNDVSAITYAPNQPKYKLDKGIADTTGVVHAGLIFNYNKRWNFEISGKADFNADYQTYTGRALLRYNF